MMNPQDAAVDGADEETGTDGVGGMKPELKPGIEYAATLWSDADKHGTYLAHNAEVTSFDGGLSVCVGKMLDIYSQYAVEISLLDGKPGVMIYRRQKNGTTTHSVQITLDGAGVLVSDVIDHKNEVPTP